MSRTPQTFLKYGLNHATTLINSGIFPAYTNVKYSMWHSWHCIFLPPPWPLQTPTKDTKAHVPWCTWVSVLTAAQVAKNLSAETHFAEHLFPPVSLSLSVLSFSLSAKESNHLCPVFLYLILMKRRDNQLSYKRRYFLPDIGNSSIFFSECQYLYQAGRTGWGGLKSFIVLFWLFICEKPAEFSNKYIEKATQAPVKVIGSSPQTEGKALLLKTTVTLPIEQGEVELVCK